MTILFIPAIFMPFLSAVLVLAIVLIPSLWLFFRFMNVITAFAEVLFGDICDVFSALFGKYTSAFRNSGPLGKALCIAGGAAVVFWIINWLRY